jgi:hypothetical protein
MMDANAGRGSIKSVEIEIAELRAELAGLRLLFTEKFENMSRELASRKTPWWQAGSLMLAMLVALSSAVVSPMLRTLELHQQAIEHGQRMDAASLVERTELSRRLSALELQMQQQPRHKMQ